MKVTTFKHEIFGELRTVVMPDGQIGFVGRDVARALGYAKPQNAIASHVDEEDKTTAPIQGTGSNCRSLVTVISESGLYSLILSSKKQEAKEFKPQDDKKNNKLFFFFYYYANYSNNQGRKRQAERR